MYAGASAGHGVGASAAIGGGLGADGGGAGGIGAESHAGGVSKKVVKLSGTQPETVKTVNEFKKKTCFSRIIKCRKIYVGSLCANLYVFCSGKGYLCR